MNDDILSTAQISVICRRFAVTKEAAEEWKINSFRGTVTDDRIAN